MKVRNYLAIKIKKVIGKFKNETPKKTFGLINLFV